MKLELQNNQIANVISLLEKMKLKGLPSIHRTRLAKKLTEFLQRAAEEQKEIQKEYFELDKDGEPIVEEKKCKDTEGYHKTMEAFLTEKVVVSDGDSQVMLKSVRKSLEDSDLELEGVDAYTFENLYTSLGGLEEENEKETEETE